MREKLVTLTENIFMIGILFLVATLEILEGRQKK